MNSSAIVGQSEPNPRLAEENFFPKWHNGLGSDEQIVLENSLRGCDRPPGKGQPKDFDLGSRAKGAIID
jgi:hypothetical protein